ncbi:MAG: hypothetical protein CMN28_16460 [Salinisphaeraceae bacterium]|jgi:hypothetical protein|nr:hypothetical protein [Salinisphaeraceae bacterium]
MTDKNILPAGFESLEPFVEYWAGETNDIRWDRRSRASMPDIQAFYDAMLARAEDAIQHLEKFPLGDMPPAEERLFCLTLSLVHASIAVELHEQPRAIDSPFPHGLHVTRGPWPHGGGMGQSA